MRGAAPIRQTLKYLEKGSIVFKERVKIVTVNYNEPHRIKSTRTEYNHHNGAREFVFWTIPQLQYKNPNIQIATFKNLTPSPFVTCYLENGDQVLFDVDGQTKDEIVQRLQKTLGKSEDTLQAEALASQKTDNPANFGVGCDRYCICSQPGQVPCPGLLPLPKPWRGKYYWGHASLEDEQEEASSN